jgi:polyisoprenoid-binding protein YceI
MVISTVKGNFTDYSVKIYFDEGDMIKSRAVATIKTASIFTNNEMRDNHLRSEEFFFAEKYPEITFKSTKIVKKAENSILYGTLTMRGVSQEVVIPFKFLGKAKDPWGSTRIGFEGNLTLNRQDYGIAFNKTIDNGGLLVGNEVEIQLNIEAVLQNK